MRRCTACILPEKYPLIEFDAAGVCNYCRSGVTSLNQNRAKGNDVLRERIDRLRGKFARHEKYDCLIALSGGRDSSYVAYYVRQVLGFRPLLFVNDNGMMPDETRRNIERIGERLEADIVVRHKDMRHIVGKAVRHWVRKPSPAMIGTFCTGCMTGINGGLMAVADEYRTHLVITGGGGELPSIGATFPLQLLTESMDLSKWNLLRGFTREFFKNPGYALDLSLMKSAAEEAFYRFSWDAIAKSKLAILSLYAFVDWNETEINETIKRELGWQRPPGSTNDWRTDCKLHRVKEFLYERTLGFTKNDDLLSCLVRRGEITRDEALRRMAVENSISEDYLKDACGTIDIDLGDLRRAAESYRTQDTELQSLDALRS